MTSVGQRKARGTRGDRRRRLSQVADDRVAVGALRILPAAGARLPTATFLGGELTAPILSDVVTLGRDLGNAIVLPDPSVSREQARIARDAAGWEVTNCSRGQALLVGGHEAAPGASARIAPGDVVTVGGVALQLVAPRAPGNQHQAEALAAMPTQDTNALGPGVTLRFALRSRRNARWWWIAAIGVALLCAASVIIAFGAAILVGRSATATGGLGRAVSAVTLPLVPAIGAALLVALLDRYEREPLVLLCAAFVWGAVVAIPPVIGVERLLVWRLLGDTSGIATSYAHAGIQAAIAALVEELFKSLGLVALIAVVRDEFDNVTDGVLYGVVIGAGFAFSENFAYFAFAARGEIGSLVLGRILLGWLSHATFTALVGAGLGYARERGGVWRWRAPLLGFAAACLLHFAFDAVVFGADVARGSAFARGNPGIFTALALTLAYGPLLATQASLLHWTLAALRREAEIVRAFLVGEVEAGQVTIEEYVLAQDARLRGRAERTVLTEHGGRAYLTVRALHQTIIGLAFRHWHVGQGDPRKPGAEQPEDAYRARITRLRWSLARQLQPPNAEHQRVLGGGHPGDIVLRVAENEEAAERDELLIQRVLDRDDDRRGQI